MSNEKYINNNSWKVELDALTVLPAEENYDSNAAWEKLDKRLHEKKGNKRSTWYWMAAACVIICFVILVIQLSNKKETAVQNFVQHNSSPVKKENIQITAPVISNEVAATSPIKENKVIPAVQKRKMVHASQPIVIIASPTPEILTEKNDPGINKNIIPQNSNLKPIVFTVLKKKIPVVHVNDLEKPVNPIESVAGNNDHVPLRVRLFNRVSFPESSSTSADGGNILKIKLSPQN